MKKTLLILLGIVLAAVAPPLLSAKEVSKAQTKKTQTAACCVCAHYGDSACLEVEVNEDTPSVEYQGKTYCFCSQTCKKAFLRKPKKFIREKLLE